MKVNDEPVQEGDLVEEDAQLKRRTLHVKGDYALQIQLPDQKIEDSEPEDITERHQIVYLDAHSTIFTDLTSWEAGKMPDKLNGYLSFDQFANAVVEANVALREATAIKGWKGYTGFCVLLFFASILALVTIPILSIPAWSVVYWHRTRWHNAVRAAAKSASRQLRDSGVLGVELRLLCEHWGDGRLAFVLAPAVP